MDNLDDFSKSKTQKKREQTQLQDFGVSLAKLSNEKLNKLPVPDELRKALQDYKKMKSHGAITRQAQFIGKVMRRIDHETLLEAWEKLDVKDNHLLIEAETWQTRLLTEGATALSEFISQYQPQNSQKLRQLLRQCQKETETVSKHNQKKLFNCIINILDIS